MMINGIDAMEREHQEEEKMYSAIQQGTGRKAIEAVRAESSMQMHDEKDVFDVCS